MGIFLLTDFSLNVYSFHKLQENMDVFKLENPLKWQKPLKISSNKHIYRIYYNSFRNMMSSFEIDRRNHQAKMPKTLKPL